VHRTHEIQLSCYAYMYRRASGRDTGSSSE